MEFGQDEHHQINTDNPGAVVEHIDHENGYPTFKSEVPAVDAGIIDASIFTPPVIANPTDLLKCPTASENFNVKEDITVHHDDGDLTAQKLSPLPNDDEDEHSKYLEAIDENVSDSPDTAAKIVLSRERKKSKYLCYPFINLEKGSKVLHFSAESEIDDSKILSNCSKRKRDSRKSLTTSFNIEEITASSSELLMQLRVVAIDHLSPYYDSAFDSKAILFNRFRESVFTGLSNSQVLGVDEDTQKEEDGEFHAHDENKNKNKKPVRKTRKEKPPSDLYDVNVNVAKMKPQKKRKKSEATITPPAGPTNGDPTEKNQQPRRRGRPKGVKQTPPGIPYINGNSVKPISLEVCLQDAGPYDPNPNSAAPLPEIQAPEKSSAEVTIDQMKQSLLFMTSMLEKSATTISPETRASLEIEIKNLLKKVNPVVSSSS